MNPNNITNKEIYEGVALALSKFSDEFPTNTAALRVDATVVVSPNVNVTNGPGAAAVNIQDGGNSITVDGTVTVVPSGTQNENLIQVGGVAITLGQKTMAASLPIVISSDQSAVPVSATDLDIRNLVFATDKVDVSGSTIAVTLPTGAQTITSSVVTDDNTIAAGASSLGFTTSSDYTGNINGVARTASTFYGFEAAQGKTLPAVTYTTTTGSITIDQII